jgi:hypothetical protein
MRVLQSTLAFHKTRKSVPLQYRVEITHSRIWIDAYDPLGSICDYDKRLSPTRDLNLIQSSVSNGFELIVAGNPTAHCLDDSTLSATIFKCAHRRDAFFHNQNVELGFGSDLVRVRSWVARPHGRRVTKPVGPERCHTHLGLEVGNGSERNAHRCGSEHIYTLT